MSYISRYQWHKENCLKWMRRHRRDIAELIAAALFALFLGFITTCHTRKIEASFKGYQLKGIYSSNNGFEVLYQKDGQVLSAIFPDRSHAEYFAEVFK
jgi:hypothetical protein